ncbi:hypothetical protein N7455_001735 [Penicillium solitum]|uniref:uncharacterized protein n=1 Tax=Penicillium solitum TaxID=60172 RepID=UPI0032C483A4|nr:hypothetical protein N7536_005771 [Penicillium majusculum]KAJ5878270.1 hypothetical protein N7455_001735 [Penicillium solitum]
MVRGASSVEVHRTVRLQTDGRVNGLEWGWTDFNGDPQREQIEHERWFNHSVVPDQPINDPMTTNQGKEC